MRLVDAFLYNGEDDLLELRFRYLWGHVDRFVIVEGDRDFAGRPKATSLPRLRREFQWCWERVSYVRAELLESPPSRWDNERLQRDALAEPLEWMEPEDWLLMSDADEIPHREQLRRLREMDHVTTLTIRNHYYHLNTRDYGWGHDVQMPKIVAAKRRDLEGRHTPHALQMARLGLPSVQSPEGWHFSYLGGPEAIARKLSQFSHAEYDTPEFACVERLRRTIEAREDLFGRPEHAFRTIPLDASFPEPLLEDPQRWQHLLA